MFLKVLMRGVSGSCKAKYPAGNFKLDLETGRDQQRHCRKSAGKKMS